MHYFKQYLKSTLIAGAMCLLIVTIALAQTGGQYDLTWFTIDSGGGASQGAAYQLADTLGQPDAAVWAGGDYNLQGGFWQSAATIELTATHLIALASFDNNLDPQSAGVIENIRQGTAAPSTAVATLLIDGAGIGDTRVLQIAGGVITPTNVPAFTGELDTANPDVIASFLIWARAQHPADRTVVALLGHGAGLTPEIHSPRLSGEGLGVRSHVPPLPMSRDATPMDVTSGTYLSTPELGRALDAATNHGANPFDVLFLDQCFGGGLDTLVEIRAAASVFVASPNYAWGAFAYDRYLPRFTSAATPEDMAQAIVDEYEAALDDTHPNAIFWLRGSDIVTITNAVSNLGDALRTAPTADVLAAALNSQFVDTTLCTNDWQLCPPDEEVGLRSFAAQLQSRAAVGSAVYTTAGEVLTALSGVHSNTAHAAGAPWPKPEVQQWNLADLGPTVLAPLTRTLAASGDIWRASLYTSTVPLTAILSWSPTQTVMITTPWASTINSGWARFLAAWYGPLTPTIGAWCNSLPPILIVVTGTDSITLTAQGGLVSARLAWTPVVTSTAVDYAVYVLRPNDGTWELAATVPLTQTAFTHLDLPSGVYRYFIVARNDQGQAVALSDKISVDVGVTSIDPGYGLNSVPTMVYLRGSGFEAPITVTIGSVALPDVLVVDPHTLHVVIPAGLAPGVYDVTVSTAAGQVMMPNAFRVLDAVVVDDLVSSSDQLATNPLTVRAAHTTTIEFAFQRLGGKFTLDEVTVAIRVNGVLLDNAWTSPVSPNSTASASPVSWLPPAKGDYQVCAIIDPANVIPESDETNNRICNTITVLPVADDMVPPVVAGFVIDHDAPVTTILTATLTVTATDPLPNPSGVKCVKFYEFEWSQGVRRWLPVTRSGCVDYAASPTDYPWQLLNIPGIRYMEAWAQDNAGNISLAPGIDTIDLAPTAQNGAVAQNGVIFYRFYVRQGQAVVTSLVSLDGDADLYVWGPGNQLWYSNNAAGLEDRVAFNAPITGTYQIEVHGYTAAHYRLSFGSAQPGSPSLGSPSSLTATRNADKPMPGAPAVPLDSWPNSRIVRPPDWPDTKIKVYLPIAVR